MYSLLITAKDHDFSRDCSELNHLCRKHQDLSYFETILALWIVTRSQIPVLGRKQDGRALR